MTEDTRDRLGKIIAKSLRKAKRWYLSYIACQIVILTFAIVLVFANFDPRLFAVLAFVLALLSECLRWRSDNWKSQGEMAKRRWEISDGLGEPIDDKIIGDWLAAKPPAFLADVRPDEIEGTKFDSKAPPGPNRLVENTEESAWWSKHLSRFTAWYLGFLLCGILIGSFVAMTLSIAALSAANVEAHGRAAQNVGAIICSVLAFVFSINVVRLFVDFLTFFHSNKALLARCDKLLEESNFGELIALSLLHDYQTARSSAPMLPTFVWKWHCKHLRKQWIVFRSDFKGTARANILPS